MVGRHPAVFGSGPGIGYPTGPDRSRSVPLFRDTYPMPDVAAALTTIRERITEAERRFERPPGSVTLLAVCKKKPQEAVRNAHEAGQRAFAENHLQEALPKLETLDDLDLEWHFIGPIQSNKTRPIAQEFDWVHSVDRLKIAKRLSEQRDRSLGPLNVCVQVNVSGEASKSGVAVGETEALVSAVADLPGLKLRGLMAIPKPERGFEAQRASYRVLGRTLADLNRQGLGLDTLSMGMTDDMEAAIAEGATIVRIGTAIFGIREAGSRGQ